MPGDIRSNHPDAEPTLALDPQRSLDLSDSRPPLPVAGSETPEIGVGADTCALVQGNSVPGPLTGAFRNSTYRSSLTIGDIPTNTPRWTTKR